MTIIDPPSLLAFFGQHIPSSFFEISQWQVDDAEKTQLVSKLLELGHSLIRNGMNRYKAFVFYLPPLYTQLTQKDLLSDSERVLILQSMI
jgi:hypothetical protein